MKKLISLIIIITGVIFIYSKIIKKGIHDEFFINFGYMSITDIISMNRDSLKEMAQAKIEESVNWFHKTFWKDIVEILPDNDSPRELILWNREDNKEMKVRFFRNEDGAICGEQYNIVFLAYLISSAITPFTYDEIQNQPIILQQLNNHIAQNPKGFSFLSDCKSGISQEVQSQLKQYQVPLERFLEVKTAANLQFTLTNFWIQKINTLFPANRVRRKLLLEIFLKDKQSQWPLAYLKYHLDKHWLFYKYQYYRDLLLFFAAVILIIFFFIQFFRKDIKKIIKEELEKNGVSLSIFLIYKIFFQNWGCLIYQAKDERVRSKISGIAIAIANKIREEKLKKRTNELWQVYRSANLPKEKLKPLQGLYRTAMDNSSSLSVKEAALQSLQGNLGVLVKKTTDEITPLPIKKRKGESPRELHIAEIKTFIEIAPKLLEQLSMSDLKNLLRTIEVLPKIHPEALNAFLEIGIACALSNQKFVNALFTEDSRLLKQCLGLTQQKTDPSIEEFKPPTDLLSGQRVVITSGRLAYRMRHKLVQWTMEIGADAAEFVDGKKYNLLAEKAADASMVIFILPIDHAALYKLKSQKARIIWINHFSRIAFWREMMARLAT